MTQAKQSRMTSLSQLGELRDEITIPVQKTQHSFNSHMQERRPHHNHHKPVNNNNFVNRLQQTDIHPHANSAYEVARAIQKLNRPEQPEVSIPSLVDFILMLQEHRFSFTLDHDKQLRRFIATQRNENRFFNIAWAGGDEYMAALMLYTKAAMTLHTETAVNAALDALIPKEPKPPKPRKVRQEKTEPDTSTENVKIADIQVVPPVKQSDLPPVTPSDSEVESVTENGNIN